MSAQDRLEPDGAREREQRSQELDTIIEHMLKEDAELLERLADA